MTAAPEITPVAGDSLLIIDVQLDFLPGGSLAVPAGNEVIAPLNQWIERFVAAGLPIFVTRDWHPADHCSFQAQGGPWPIHCVAGTEGARWPADLALPATAQVISKAVDAHGEAYSGFTGTGLDERLQKAGCRRLFVGGLATDYCVSQTVKDALGMGYGVVLLLAGMRAINQQPGDGARAIVEMMAMGAIALGNGHGH